MCNQPNLKPVMACILFVFLNWSFSFECAVNLLARDKGSIFFNPVAFCPFYKSKYFIDPLPLVVMNIKWLVIALFTTDRTVKVALLHLHSNTTLAGDFLGGLRKDA
jgi:hypothetical protein